MRVAPEDLTLTNWPLRDDKLAALGLAAALVGLSIAVGWYVERAGAGAAAAAALFAATWRWWTPVRFVFGPSGVAQTRFGRTRRRPWTTIQSFQTLDYGVLLLPEPADPPIAALRGVYVAWGDRRAELLTLLDFYVGVRSSDSRVQRSTVHGAEKSP